ncbi:hypothetical protein LOC71_10500 [Rhodopirellula sp. JC740]|uniref:Uncharacterized protein n=1 Tax=Rhodopirellula halodulae TaxID=2894198 RepID=A0ABS8NGN5_9BACT|nr:hypothetical protein [Rhodopirellula sp. JC740]
MAGTATNPIIIAPRPALLARNLSNKTDDMANTSDRTPPRDPHAIKLANMKLMATNNQPTVGSVNNSRYQ